MNKYLIKKFSIIELITACAVIVILMTIGVGAYRLIIEKIHETRTVALIKKLEMAMRSYQHETGYYFQYNDYEDDPSHGGQLNLPRLKINESDRDFTQLIDYSAMIGRKEIDNEGYVKDAWGNFIYYFTGNNKKNTTLFDLGSPGKNGGWGALNSSDSVDTEDFGDYDDITNTNR